MRCPSCSEVEDKVIDSRTAEEGAAIRRRRECLACGRRFTTFERIEGVEEGTVMVLKRSGTREVFDPAKVVAGVRAATKNRPVSEAAMVELAGQVEEAMRAIGSEVTTQQIGLAVLDRLASVDEVAYLRFASVYKGFEEAGDFQRELGLLTKSTEPKRRD
ncbi:MAG: transcriptional regulator NrdR [Acidimicrobiales bacterium]